MELYPDGYKLRPRLPNYTRTGVLMPSSTSPFAHFVRERRLHLRLTQRDLAERAGVGLRFIRELEQGKETLQLDKVNQVLALFGYHAGPVRTERREE